mgnify:CR=1 FL=1|jgi:predicted DNA-binding mobile mystery protein A
MSTIFKKLKYHQTESSLELWRTAELSLLPKQGWIRTIRNALGMSAGALGRRLGMTSANVLKAEKSEARDTITLKSLRKLAEALDCDLKYALVPRYSLEEMKTRQAKKIAHEKMQSIGHSMKLEGQEVDSAAQKLLFEELVKSLLEGSGKELWK